MFITGLANLDIQAAPLHTVSSDKFQLMCISIQLFIQAAMSLSIKR